MILLETGLEMLRKITAFPKVKYHILLHNDSMRALEVGQDCWRLSNPALTLGRANIEIRSFCQVLNIVLEVDTTTSLGSLFQ